VTSKCVASEMWYSPLLEPFVDHVPVKADLSDLREQIQWCRAHDGECEEMAVRASALYDKYLSKEGVYDYVEVLCAAVAKNYAEPAGFYTQPPTLPGKPHMRAPKDMCIAGQTDRYCKGCIEGIKEESQRKRSQKRERVSGVYR
jgi:hypothetical protein